MTTLREAAIAVIERWDAPQWRDQPSTARYLEDLRTALDAPEQEPVAHELFTDKFAIGTQLVYVLPPNLASYVRVRPLYAAPVAAPEPYDQQALQLCGACGWKAIMPGEPCFVCNMHIGQEQVAVPAWTLTADKMPEPCTKVLAYTGKGQPIRAQWVPAKTLEDNGDGDFGEYDEATDTYYWPEAWYETNAHEETNWTVGKPVTHWMPLPQPPQGDKP